MSRSKSKEIFFVGVTIANGRNLMGRFAPHGICLLALTACVVAFTQAAIAADAIKVGMVASLTGPAAESGQAAPC